MLAKPAPVVLQNGVVRNRIRSMSFAAVFIDGPYLRSVLRSHRAPPVHVGRLGSYLARPDELLRVYLYEYLRMTPSDEAFGDHFSDTNESVLANLQEIAAMRRCVVRTGVERVVGVDARSGESILIRSNLGVQLAADLIGLVAKQRVSRIVLLTGDEAWGDAAAAAREEGVRVTLGFGKGKEYPSPALWNSAEQHLSLGMEDLLLCTY